MKNIEALFEGSREIGLEVNTEKTKYMCVFHHRNAGQNQILLTANKYFENITRFKHLGTIVTFKIEFMKK